MKTMNDDTKATTDKREETAETGAEAKRGPSSHRKRRTSRW